MKVLHHPITLSLGISTACLLFLIGPYISPDHFAIYHLTGSSTPLFIEAAIDFCYLWLLLAGVLFLAEKYRPLWLPVWLGVILFLPWMVAKNVIMLQAWPVPRRVMISTFALCLGLWIGLLFMRRAWLQKRFPPVQHVVSVLIGFNALAGAAILVQLLWCGWESRNLNPPFAGNVRNISAPENSKRTRVIWIVLDELSYQQIYGQRYSGLSLPAFERLADQSVVFTHVVPAAVLTDLAVPSLFSGLPTDRSRVPADGSLKALHNPVTGDWQPFDQHNTVFEDARSANYATGVAGWFNPYCRILPAVLDQCFWTYRNPKVHYIPADRTWQATVLSPVLFLTSYFENLLGVGAAPPPENVVNADKHIHDFEEIRDVADKLLADPSMDFVFLHLPVPHPDGIFDRKRMTFVAAGSTYLDNLVLADQYLAHVYLLLEKQHQWDSSAVVVMGDHSWRTTLFWKDSPSWTAEEERASGGGQYDGRPGYIVKMPMQETPVRVDTPFPAVKTRALLDAIMSHQLRTGEDLKAWAGQQH